MIKFGCAALIAVASFAIVPVAHAAGNFFVSGQVGKATYDDFDIGDDSATTRAISGGYRWQAGPVVQVGIEAGYGKVDEVGGDYQWGNGYTSYGNGRVGIESDYLHVGANARFNFGADSRFFAMARAGYFAYEQDVTDTWVSYYQGTPVASGSGSFSDDGGGAYFGAGIGYDITPNFSVQLMANGYAYSNFEGDDWDDDVGTASTTTLGLEVRF